MRQWSPQCRWVQAFGPLRPGVRTLSLNRRDRLFWFTTFEQELPDGINTSLANLRAAAEIG